MADGMNVSDFLKVLNRSGFTTKASSSDSFDGTLIVNTNAQGAEKDLEKLLKTIGNTTEAVEKLKDGLESLDDHGGDKLLKRQKEILSYLNDQLKVSKNIEKSVKNQGILNKRISAIQEIMSDSMSDVAKLTDRINKLKEEGLELDKDMLKLNENGADAEAARKKYLTQVLVIQKQNLAVQQRTEKSLKDSATTAGKFSRAMVNAKQGMKDFARAIPGKAVDALGSKLAQIGTWGMVLHQLVDTGRSLTDMSYGLSLMPGHIRNTAEKTAELNNALQSVRNTAAAYNFDMGEANKTLDELARKVRFVKTTMTKDEAGNITGITSEVDTEKLAAETSKLLKFSKLNNVDISTAIGMYKTNIEKFGMSKDDAIKSMESITDRTLYFNEVLGDAGFHAEDVAQHLANVQQNTRYWVQDMGMLNTMFGNHLALLAKQGKSQEHALALASKFNEAVNEPPPLVKWTAGNKMLKELRTEMAKARKVAKDSGKDVKQAEQDAVRKKFLGSMASVREENGKLIDKNGNELTGDQARQYRARANQADTFYKAMQGGNTGFTLSNMLQEMGGGMGFGLKGTIEGWQKYQNMDATVLSQSLGLGSNAAEAEELRQLIKSINTGNYSDDAFTDKESLLKARAIAEGFTEDQMKKKKGADGNETNEYENAEFAAFMEKQGKLVDILTNNNAESIELNAQTEYYNTVTKWLDNFWVKLAAAGGSTALGVFGGVFGGATAGSVVTNILNKRHENKLAKAAEKASKTAEEAGKAAEKVAGAAEEGIKVAEEGAKVAEAAQVAEEGVKVAEEGSKFVPSLVEEASKAADAAGKGGSSVGLNVMEEMAKAGGKGGTTAVEAVAKGAGTAGELSKALEAGAKASKGGGKKALATGAAVTLLTLWAAKKSSAAESGTPAGEVAPAFAPPSEGNTPGAVELPPNAVPIIPMAPELRTATDEQILQEAEQALTTDIPDTITSISDDVHAILELQNGGKVYMSGSSADLNALSEALTGSKSQDVSKLRDDLPSTLAPVENPMALPPKSEAEELAETVNSVAEAVEVGFGAYEAVNLANMSTKYADVLSAVEKAGKVGKAMPVITGGIALAKTGANIANGDYVEAAKSAGAGAIDTAMMANPVTAAANFLFSGVTTLTSVVGDLVGFEAKSMSPGEFVMETGEILSNLPLLLGFDGGAKEEAEERLTKSQIKLEDALAAKAEREDKAAYDQLDAFGKLLKNSEDMLKLHEKWYQLDMEGQVRDIMMNDDLSESDKKKLLNGMAGGVAGARDVRLAMDVSGKATITNLDKLVAAYGGT